jgi:hypothetical protein
MFNKFKNNLPLINFFVSSSGLLFQVSILYPWHNELSENINGLKKIVYEKINK